MARGDHLIVDSTLRGVPFEHHGIDLGDGLVIHLCPADGSRLAWRDRSGRYAVRRTALAEFTDGRAVRVKRHPDQRDPEQVAAAAESQVGLVGYHLLSGNCEHFATLCATGRSTSQQVEMGVAAASSVASAATKTCWALTARWGGRAVIRGASKFHPAALLADGVELVTLAVGCRRGLSAPVAKRLARLSGGLTALGVGAVLGGPAGAMAGLATHASATACADRLCHRLQHWLR